MHAGKQQKFVKWKLMNIIEEKQAVWQKEEEQRPGCLFLLPRALFPVVSGYSNKNIHLLPFLAQHYRLHLILLTDKPLLEEEQLFYRKAGIRLTVCRFSKADHIKGALWALLCGKPLQVGYYYSRKMQKYVDEQQEPQRMIAGLVRTAEYLLRYRIKAQKDAEQKARFFDMVDSIGCAYERSAKTTKSMFWKLIYHFEAKHLLNYEQTSVAAFRNTFFVNREEEKKFRSFGKTACLHHGVKDELFDYSKKDGRYCGYAAFLGKMNYQPNIDAVQWYLENVQAQLGEKIPLLVIGAYPTPELKRIAGQYPGTELTGYCDDPYIYLNSAMAVIAPMRSGGGIQNKVLEAMALGKLVILSRLAAEAIAEARDGEHFLVAETAEEYRDILLDIREKPEKYSQIGAQAKALIRNYYTWEHYCTEYLQALQD